ncbi:hypothetical protein TG4357_03668 [Thalassovita gelatinovora]|uniref:Uncharacterized protein n=1 Tax=Thalassovita gelatinovora TaxID=53501 RepID=A0A0P1G5M8_THAGE|nr:hypothetical protein [Thalassovita gelatinovora]QIZ79009.1 hypothetical protein HFZ77_00225 [Thalassovita gelatinovora]CUH68563.1 hypothetical protein TG4357_03668 [Thalassovita gelatinovora]SEQ54651.1 hypothetical protein SAMN04488043_106129 [Thalassovita gelatinovora]
MTVHQPTFSDAGLAAASGKAGATADPALEVAPFARLAIGESAYEVGTVKTDTEAVNREILAFRSVGDEAWKQLKAGLDDGWRPVAAEVVRNTRDALHDYVRMHMIRRSGKFHAGDKVSLTLFGFDWEVRVSSDGKRVQVKLPETAWEEVDRALVQEYSDMKELAIAALIRFSPSIHKVFEDDVDAWALRLAAGASVTPIM